VKQWTAVVYKLNLSFRSHYVDLTPWYGTSSDWRLRKWLTDMDCSCKYTE